MIVKLHISNLKMLNKILKEWFGGMFKKKALDEHVVHCKQFQNIGLHTFVGMVGYCMKDIDENHFQFIIEIVQFYLIAGWMVLFHIAIMDYQWSKSFWKCMVAPPLMDLHDIAQIWEVTKEELYNCLHKKIVKKNCNYSPLKMLSDSNGT